MDGSGRVEGGSPQSRRFRYRYLDARTQRSGSITSDATMLNDGQSGSCSSVHRVVSKDAVWRTIKLQGGASLVKKVTGLFSFSRGRSEAGPGAA